MIDGHFECFTLEDKRRDKKVYGKTCIPASRYKIKWRDYGKHYTDYKKKFHWHQEMMEIEDVEGFTDILIHIGNSHKDTKGCLLVGNYVTNNHLEMGFLRDSTGAYKTLYLKALECKARNESIYITFHDLDEIHR